jgi:hypothetical protein
MVTGQRGRALDCGTLAAWLGGGRGRAARTAARGVSHGGGRGMASIGDRRDKDVRERGGALLLWGGCAHCTAAAPVTVFAPRGGGGDACRVQVMDR